VGHLGGSIRPAAVHTRPRNNKPVTKRQVIVQCLLYFIAEPQQKVYVFPDLCQHLLHRVAAEVFPTARAYGPGSKV